MIKRTYTGEADLYLLQDLNAAAIATTNHCGYLHPGDIPHHIYNGNKYYDPVELMTIGEDDQGVAAWLLVGWNSLRLLISVIMKPPEGFTKPVASNPGTYLTDI